MMDRESTSARPRMRPRFEIESPLEPQAITDAFRAELAKQGEVSGLVVGNRIELILRSSARRFWSPQLTIDVDDEADRGSRLRCRFGPHPDVWTLYVAIHATGALATIGAAVWGLSQHLSGQTPWGLWALPAAPVLALLVWALAFVGQGLSFEQMVTLRAFTRDITQGRLLGSRPTTPP